MMDEEDAVPTVPLGTADRNRRSQRNAVDPARQVSTGAWKVQENSHHSTVMQLQLQSPLYRWRNQALLDSQACSTAQEMARDSGCVPGWALSVESSLLASRPQSCKLTHPLALAISGGGRELSQAGLCVSCSTQALVPFYLPSSFAPLTYRQAVA